MNRTDNLDAFWISKLGSDRLSDLTETSGEDVSDKALAVVRELAKNRNRFYDLLFEGFDGYFHQSVYARKDTSLLGRLKQLSIGKTAGKVEWWSKQSGDDQVRVLAGVRKDVEFVVGSRVVTETIPIPAMVEASASSLRVRILTVQSKPETWGKLLNLEITRMLTPIKDTELSETIYDALHPELAEFGKIQNLSSMAVKLMKDIDHVLTYSGTFGVKNKTTKVGRTRHSTDGRFGTRNPMHVVMEPEFKQLVGSTDIRHCEIVIKTDHHGLIPGTALVFFPDEGKIIFRRMLGKGVIDAFLANLAG
jgi:hypothetical protein